MACTVVAVQTALGQDVRAGQTLLVVEAMKMEHEIHAQAEGRVVELLVAAGEMVAEGDLLMRLAAMGGGTVAAQRGGVPGLASAASESGAELRADLREVQQRHAFTQDAQRPDAVARRRATGQLTARENLARLCDEGSFSEYGALAIAAQRSRRTLDDLVQNTPADGMVTGIASVNSSLFGPDKTRCVVMHSAKEAIPESATIK